MAAKKCLIKRNSEGRVERVFNPIALSEFSAQQETLAKERATTIVTKHLSENLGYDISILPETQMVEELGRRGYENTLKIKDKIYGFYDNTTQQIFLTEEFLTSESLIHENYHAFSPVLKKQANEG